MDTFMEYMIKQKWTKSTILKAVLIITGACMLCFALLWISLLVPFFFGIGPHIQIVMYLSFLIIAGIFFGAYKLISRLDVEFEYAFTNGELDIDKIIHRKRRKHLVSIEVKAFLKFGKKSDESKETLDEEYARIIDATANSKVYEDYYAVFFKNGQKVKLYFTPTSKMIDEFKLYAPRVIM